MTEEKLIGYKSIDILDTQKTLIVTIFLNPPRLVVYDDEMYHFIPILRPEWRDEITIDNIMMFLKSRVDNLPDEEQWDAFIEKDGTVHSDTFSIFFRK